MNSIFAFFARKKMEGSVKGFFTLDKKYFSIIITL